MKKSLVFSLAFVLIISALLLVGCSKEPEKEPAAECTHSYEKTVTSPTCTEAGEEKFSCTKCDYYYTIEIEATGHTGGTPVEENSTICIDGKYDTVVYCTVCEAELSRETTILTALGHTHGTPVEENSTICIDGKYDSVIYCTVCDAEVSREIVTVTEKIHDVQNGVCTICGGRESTPGLQYSRNADGTYTVTSKGTCMETDIVIGIYKNRDVTSIGNDAFYQCPELTSIVISKGVTTIGDEAFYLCNWLTSIELPEGVTSIGAKAFYNCPSLTSIEFPDGLTIIGDYAFFDCASLTSIEFPDSLTTIGNRAFSYCTSLTGIELPDSLTTIGDYAFVTCTSLESIVIPEGVTTIGNRAFYECTAVTSIELPDSLTTIGDGAFYKCASLTSITVAEDNENYKSVDGNLYSKDGKTLIQYAIGKTDTAFTVPEGVTTIGWYAFGGCISLKSIVIPEGVTTIGNSVFSGCTSLTSIELPDSLTTIGDGAFSLCTSLTIYCAVAEKPSGWSDYWNASNRPVVWGYTGE